MTITLLSGHTQLMVLVFLPRESLRDILAILHSKDSIVPRTFPLKNQGTPGTRFYAKEGDGLARVFQNSTLPRRLHVCDTREL